MWLLEYIDLVAKGDIQEVPLGGGGPELWENPGGKDPLFLISPKFGSAKPANIPGNAPFWDAANTVNRQTLWALYLAFWRSGEPTIVAQLPKGATKLGTADLVPGWWLERPPGDPSVPFFVAKQTAAWSLLSPAQANKVPQLVVQKAYAYFTKTAEAKALFNTVNATFGGKLTVQAALGLPFPGKWNSEHTAIVIDPFNHKNPVTTGSSAELAGVILFELINASNAAKFAGIAAEAREGTLDRIDFAVAYEKVEYDGRKKHFDIASKTIDWSDAANLYKSSFCTSSDVI